MNSTQVEIRQSHYCDDKDKKNEWWKLRQKKHIIQHKCDVTYKHNQKQQSSKKLQQDNSELWKLVSLKAHEN